MKAYQHILLTTDFSKSSEIAAKKAIHLAGHFNAEITLLHVIEQDTKRWIGELVGAASADVDQHLLAQQHRRLDEFIRSVPNFRAIPMVRLPMRNIEDEIITVAKEIMASLIIIGTAEHRTSMRSSLSAEVFKGKAPCDVLVVRG